MLLHFTIISTTTDTQIVVKRCSSWDVKNIERVLKEKGIDVLVMDIFQNIGKIPCVSFMRVLDFNYSTTRSLVAISEIIQKNAGVGQYFHKGH